MLEFARWLAATEPSMAVQNALWVIPITQCIHILAISVVFGSVLMINLRILELAGRSQTMSATARRFLPWLWGAILLAALSGGVMIVGEPIRELENPAFWLKMAFLAVSLGGAAAFQFTLRRRLAFWESNAAERSKTRVFAVTSMLLWLAIIVLGRLIAYSQTGV